MAGQTEELRQFLLGVQSNLETTLVAVSQKLYELKEAPQKKVQVDDAPSVVSLEEAKTDGAFALPGQVESVDLPPVSPFPRAIQDSHVDLPGSDSVAEHLLLYSLDDHRNKSLAKTLFEMRKAKELPVLFWQRQIHIEDAHGQQLAKDISEFDDIQFPVTVKWEWLNRQDFPKFSYYKSAKFYWVGLTKNHHLRANFMRIHAKLRLLSLKAAALNDEWMDDMNDMRESFRKQKVSTFITSTHDHKKNGESIHETQIRIAQDVLRKLEVLLWSPISTKGKITKTSWSAAELFQMTGCALDGFLEDYLSDRDAALSCTKNRGIKRRELVKAVAKGADNLGCLCEALHDRINQNDQLHFKLVLMVWQLITIVAHLVYAYFIHPEEPCGKAGAD